VRLPEWAHKYFRKQPNNLSGQLLLTFQDGHLQHIERKDKVTEVLFYQRYSEAEPKGHHNGHATTYGSPLERPVGE
jgi:hypothetical protein